MFGWTSDKFWGSNHRSDTNDTYEGTATGAMTGLAANTKVATSMGWRDVGSIGVGDKVLTFDAGLQSISKVTRLTLWDGEGPCPRRFWPLEVPAGALGNRDMMLLLPNQSVMIESDTSQEMYGDPFSLIPAAALEGVNGICRVPPKYDFEVVILHFEHDQVVFANSGALFLCPAARDLVTDVFDTVQKPSYAILPLTEARVLTDNIAGDTVCDARPVAGLVAA